MLVAVIDPSESHRRQVSQALTSFYRVASFANADEALTALRETPPCAILVDHAIPPGGGYDLVRRLRQDRLFAGVTVVFTNKTDDQAIAEKAYAAGADSFLAKPYRRSCLIRAISHQVNKLVETDWESLPPLQKSALMGTMEVFNSISDVIEKGEPIAYNTVVEACSPLVEAVGMQSFREILNGVRQHDNYSYAHSLGTATLLLLFGYTIGLKDADLSLLGSGGLLQDVGKMLIPYEILNKPGPLTPEEFEIMKSHVPLTLDYLKKTPDIPKNVLTIAGEHHERLDGSGYPAGLESRSLNELARMAAIVDVYCALNEERIYRPPLSAEQALRVMTDEMTMKLDQNLLGLFREMLLDVGR